MRAPLLVALVAALAVSCTQSPPGTCSAHADCPEGRQCSGGVCVRLVTDGQVGSRCVREGDCAAWARCAGEVCALAPGRCGGDGECASWQTCDATHACATAPGYCAAAAGCASWQDCGADHRCVLAPGRCDGAGACESWQFCDASHRCAPSVGRCGVPADCQPWQACTSNACVTAPGRCARQSDCAAWEVCDASHACVLATGSCLDETGCADWEVCTAAHRCAAAPGRCGASPDCAYWQVCDASHACVVGAGFCADASGCADWQVCNTIHECAAAPGRCARPADCAYWQTCDASHACVVAPGWCVDDSACAAWQLCANHRCAAAPGRCDVDASCDYPLACDGGHTCVTPTLDPDVVYLAGTLEPGDPYHPYALLPLSNPGARPLVGFPANLTPYQGVIGGGDFYYTYSVSAGTVRRFVPDAFVWHPENGRWAYPPNVTANDPLLSPPTGCTPTGRWIVVGGTADLRLQCSDGRWYDHAGTLRWQGPGDDTNLRSWNASGRKLLLGFHALYVIDADGTRQQVTGVTVHDYQTFLAWKARGDGFRVAVFDQLTEDTALWEIDPSGVASTIAYPPPPSGIRAELNPQSGALDGTGALFQIGYHIGAPGDVVLKSVPGASAAVVVRDQALLGKTDWTTGDWVVKSSFSNGDETGLVTGP